MAGTALHVEITGAGTPVVLLHGLMATGDMFRWLVPVLAEQFRVVVPDLPGHGRSRGVPGPYTAEAMAGHVAYALADHGISSAHVMGYSHGGTVAQQLAYDHRALVRSLALVAAYAHNTSTPRERIEGWLAPRLVRLLGMRRLAALITKPGTGGGPSMTPDQIAWLRGMLAENETSRMAQAATQLASFDSRAWLSGIDVPTLMISGALDTAVPGHHAVMLAQGIAGSRSTVVDGAGHTMIWTHLDDLAQLLADWWNGIDPQ